MDSEAFEKEAKRLNLIVVTPDQLRDSDAMFELGQRRVIELLEGMQDDDLTEALSEAAHNAWLAEKKSRGVTSWPNERGFEQMVPYDECPEDVKEFDRVVLRAVARQLIQELNLSKPSVKQFTPNWLKRFVIGE